MKREETGPIDKTRKSKAVYPFLANNQPDTSCSNGANDYFGMQEELGNSNSRMSSYSSVNINQNETNDNLSQTNHSGTTKSGGNERGSSPLSLSNRKFVGKSIQNLVNAIRQPNPAQLSQISRFRSGSQTSLPRSRSTSLSVNNNRPASSGSINVVKEGTSSTSTNPFHTNSATDMSNNVANSFDRSYSPLHSQMNRNNSDVVVMDVDSVVEDLNPFRTGSGTVSRTGTENTSIVITNVDNSAHNTFNPVTYNYNMANSATIANLRDYADGYGIIGDTTPTTRTRANTLRGEDNVGSSSNDVLGNDLMNTIRIDDSEDENMLDNVIRGEIEGSIPFEPLHEVPEQENEIDMSDVIGDLGEEEVNGVIAPDTSVDSNNGNANNEDVHIVGEQMVVDGNPDSEADSDGNYAIRFTPAIDHSSVHPYMFFGPIIRKLQPGTSLIIGRYTEKSKKAAIAPSGSSESVVFKSKVVSRKHAELTVDSKGRWFIQDVGSSSGLFLNHVRLSQPNTSSKRVFLREGDILQFGVDYRGGSEEMYRCVKVKIEVNESWKRRGAKFSEAAHEKLRQITGSNSASAINGDNGDNGANDNSGKDKNDYTACVICLCDVRPGQPIFVAACSHLWHYRCIRPLLVKTYPQFLCPTCKGVCDLEADTDE